MLQLEETGTEKVKRADGLKVLLSLTGTPAPSAV